MICKGKVVGVGTTTKKEKKEDRVGACRVLSCNDERCKERRRPKVRGCRGG